MILQGLFVRGRFLLLALLACLAVGCGGADGPPRYNLSGKITFRGEPIPAGWIDILPDPEAGNTGPGTRATIKNGTYQTIEGKGTIGGAHLLHIYAFDGVAVPNPDLAAEGGGGENHGTPLFPSNPRLLKESLPASSGTFDIVVPDEAAAT